MKVEIHLGPVGMADGAAPARQILLIRCQPKSRRAWVATSFHRGIQQFGGKKVDHQFKSLKKGALPGFTAWLLRKQAGVVEPLSRQVSGQLGELIVQGDHNRKKTWLWALLGGDPRTSFHQAEGAWQPGDALKEAEVVVQDHKTIPKSRNLDPRDGTGPNGHAEWKELAAGLVPPVLSIEVQYKLIKSGTNAWKRFAPQAEKLTRQHELRITVASPDGTPRYIAVAAVDSDRKALGLWPWRPNAPGGWAGQSEINRVLDQGRNPKTEVTLPGLWKADPQLRQIRMTAPIECIVAVIYHLKDPADKKAHATVLQGLARVIKGLRLETTPMHFAEEMLAVGPGEDQQFWTEMEELRGQVKNRLATKNEDIEFAEAVVLPTEAP